MRKQARSQLLTAPSGFSWYIGNTALRHCASVEVRGGLGGWPLWNQLPGIITNWLLYINRQAKCSWLSPRRPSLFKWGLRLSPVMEKSKACSFYSKPISNDMRCCISQRSTLSDILWVCLLKPSWAVNNYNWWCSVDHVMSDNSCFTWKHQSLCVCPLDANCLPWCILWGICGV